MLFDEEKDVVAAEEVAPEAVEATEDVAAEEPAVAPEEEAAEAVEAAE